jgi:hypothetical protein
MGDERPKINIIKEEKKKKKRRTVSHCYYVGNTCIKKNDKRISSHFTRFLEIIFM